MADVPAKAQQLHDQARATASGGDPARALELFVEAHRAAPDWPYPPYDIGFTYLLDGNLEQAERWYAVADRLAPRGFFTVRASLHTIRLERAGTLPDGFSKAFAMLEWESPDDRQTMLEQITSQFPSFARGWKELATLLDDDDQRLAAIDRGLACDCDDDTYGMLTINKALILRNRGQQAEAQNLLRGLIASPRCTLANESMAKLSLGQ